MVNCGKLIRDRIPEILAAEGKHCDVRTLDDDEFAQKLDEKLAEEHAEYRESGEIEELVDIVEVVEAIARQRGVDWGQFELLRSQKRNRRGGSTRRFFSSGVQD